MREHLPKRDSAHPEEWKDGNTPPGGFPFQRQRHFPPMSANARQGKDVTISPGGVLAFLNLNCWLFFIM